VQVSKDMLCVAVVYLKEHIDKGSGGRIDSVADISYKETMAIGRSSLDGPEPLHG
jgi:hypothetical protein